MDRDIPQYVRLFNAEGENKDSPIINMLLASLFSSDSLLTVEDCDNSEKELLAISDSLTEANLSDERKEQWKEILDMGISICRRDKEEIMARTGASKR